MKFPLKATVFAVSALAMAGCAALPNVPQSVSASLQGRAFAVGNVTVAPSADTYASVKYHCLPDRMYATMLKDQLTTAFQNAGLNDGKGPPIRINFVIQRMLFNNNVTLPELRFMVQPSVVGLSINPIQLNGETAAVYWNLGPEWTKEKRVIPTMAIVMANGFKEIQAGNNFNDQPHILNGAAVEDYWDSNLFNMEHNKTPKDGLHQPLTVEDIERMTGTSAAKLGELCKADESRA